MMNSEYNAKPLELYLVEADQPMELPLASSGISAGFPSPANDFIESGIDLNRELVKHPSATFYGWVSGESMKDLGINDGDILVIDRSVAPAEGKVAVCFIDGEFTLKQLHIERDCCFLMPANSDYQPIKVTKDNEFVVWGIVSYVIKKV